jgi:hypothetical protein
MSADLRPPKTAVATIAALAHPIGTAGSNRESPYPNKTLTGSPSYDLTLPLAARVRGNL